MDEVKVKRLPDRISLFQNALNQLVYLMFGKEFFDVLCCFRFYLLEDIVKKMILIFKTVPGAKCRVKNPSDRYLGTVNMKQLY